MSRSASWVLNGSIIGRSFFTPLPGSIARGSLIHSNIAALGVGRAAANLRNSSARRQSR